AEDGIRDFHVTGVQTCALPISSDGERRVKTGTNSGLAVRHPRYNSPANTTSVSTPAAQRCALLMPEIMPPTCVRRRLHHSCIATDHAFALDLHAHDFVVRFDQLVADGDGQLEGD